MEEIDAHEHVGTALFSDTIVLYSRNDNDEAIRHLIATVGQLLFITMAERQRIRAGLSYGEMSIDPKESIFVGRAIVEAHRLEQTQDWSGGALTASAYARVPTEARSGKYFDWWVTPYAVPLKSGEAFSTLAIHWARGDHPNRPLFKWSPSSDKPTAEDWLSKPDICRKFVNTLAFHDAKCSWCNARNDS